MARKIETDELAGDKLELVRHGYDPYQVQRLVSALATELKALVGENDALRARLNDAPVRARDANGLLIERRVEGNSAAAIKENELLRENLRWARSALDQVLHHLPAIAHAAAQPREQSQP